MRRLADVQQMRQKERNRLQAGTHAPVVQASLQAGKAKMVIVVAAMRKLLHLVFGVLKSERPFDPTFALPACPGP